MSSAMMEYLILNEASMPYRSVEQAKRYFPEFLSIVEDAFKHQFKAILLSENLDKGWFGIPLAPDFSYSIREWLQEQEREYQRKIKSIISRTEIPQIPKEKLDLSDRDDKLSDRYELSEFFLLDNRSIAVPSLGAAYLLKQLSLSFASHDRWLASKISLWHEELTDEGNLEQEGSVSNCADLPTWRKYLEGIQAERKESLKKGKELWENRSTEFPNLVFCGKAEKQLKKLRVSDSVFDQLHDALKKLNRYCQAETQFSLKHIRKSTQLLMTDESDPVKQNPKLRQHRLFMINGTKQFFGYHVKILRGSFRLHFYPVAEEKKIYIGYFGKHLPTASNK